MIEKKVATFQCCIYMSGPIEVAKQVLREDCLREGLCVTIDPTTYIYTGGEESGFVVGLLNYPRFPSMSLEIQARARLLVEKLLDATFQHSALLVLPHDTIWFTRKEPTP